jgi:hypothetical protein
MSHTDLFASLQNLMPTGTLSVDSDELNASARYGLLQEGNLPICILRPGSSDELEAIIHYANETDLSLAVTASTGEHRKGSITNQGEHILIDLSHWKKIDLIDRRNRVCRVEPGVTYSELAIALAPHGMTIPMPLSPRDGKSVLAAVMDREPSTWANKQWDSGDPVCSTEFQGVSSNSANLAAPKNIPPDRRKQISTAWCRARRGQWALSAGLPYGRK